MESFILTRRQMSLLMASLTEQSTICPLAVLQQAWGGAHPVAIAEGTAREALLSTHIPPILGKIIKASRFRGLSLHEIAELGALVEYSTISITAMQNWVKRDFREYLGSPRQGKKYSLNQAALLFMVDDLKAALDFESIRRLFGKLFRHPDTDADDIMEPFQVYGAYAELFEYSRSEGLQERERVARAISAWIEGFEGTAGGQAGEADRAGGLPVSGKWRSRIARLGLGERETLRQTLHIALVAVQACACQALARQYANAVLFLDA
ncbi:DUF1836 domain-containing protein [Paenibacillus glufosinatiresistens]|uniref:DUF1836 domain-containing protein n=1 Tax=Paenibacillus glufosinatiresistens TaxID=3070657 RepID=UPI00286DD017|nr:DUF1836 domain-containing protein [Paenibacillus sp. YX.27]